MEHHCSGAWRRHCPGPVHCLQLPTPRPINLPQIELGRFRCRNQRMRRAMHGDIVLKRGILETKVSRGVQAAGWVVVVVVGMKSCCSGGGWCRLPPRSTNVRVNSRETASTTAAAARAVRAAGGEGGFSSVIRDHQIADTMPRHRQICW